MDIAVRMLYRFLQIYISCKKVLPRVSYRGWMFLIIAHLNLLPGACQRSLSGDNLDVIKTLTVTEINPLMPRVRLTEQSEG